MPLSNRQSIIDFHHKFISFFSTKISWMNCMKKAMGERENWKFKSTEAQKAINKFLEEKNKHGKRSLVIFLWQSYPTSPPKLYTPCWAIRVNRERIYCKFFYRNNLFHATTRRWRQRKSLRWSIFREKCCVRVTQIIETHCNETNWQIYSDTIQIGLRNPAITTFICRLIGNESYHGH